MPEKTCLTCNWWAGTDRTVRDNVRARCEANETDDRLFADSVLWTAKDFGCVLHEPRVIPLKVSPAVSPLSAEEEG